MELLHFNALSADELMQAFLEISGYIGRITQ